MPVAGRSPLQAQANKSAYKQNFLGGVFLCSSLSMETFLPIRKCLFTAVRLAVRAADGEGVEDGCGDTNCTAGF
jgi:hypothetical protein